LEKKNEAKKNRAVFCIALLGSSADCRWLDEGLVCLCLAAWRFGVVLVLEGVGYG
jgi:hypothetical protein